MKRFIALTVVLTAVIGLTLSFAGPERYEAKNVAPPMPACDWSGFYIGVNGGGGSYEVDITDNEYLEGNDTAVIRDLNGIFGGQIGYNFQKGAMVFGIEADGDWANFDARNHANSSVLGDFLDRRGQMDFMGTVRGRVGLAYENVLAYVTAGVAFASGDRSARYNEDEENIETDEFASFRSNDFRVGIAAGAGVEYMANCHWTIRLETLFADFGEDRVHPYVSSPDEAGNTYTFSDRVWVTRLGVNYKFGSFSGH